MGSEAKNKQSKERQYRLSFYLMDGHAQSRVGFLINMKLEIVKVQIIQ